MLKDVLELFKNDVIQEVKNIVHVNNTQVIQHPIRNQEPQIPREYIYLLQLREFIHRHDSVFKIGKTKKTNLTRVSHYPKGSELVIQVATTNCDTDETCLLEWFRETFVVRNDLGSEYFEGDANQMVRLICQQCETF